MNDDNELGEVRESLIAEESGLAGVHMDRPAEAVMARGQTLRLRRRLLRGLSGVTAAGAAMALALTLPGGAASGFRQVHVKETDWSVNTGRHGEVVVMVKAVPDPIRLRYVLNEAGVQAEVHWGQNCLAQAAALPSSAIVTPTYRPFPVRRKGSASAWSTYTIHPSLRPPHTTFVLGGWSVEKNSRHTSLTWAIVPAAVRVTCIPAAIAWRTECTATGRSTASPQATPSLGTTPSPGPTATPSATLSPDPAPSLGSTPSPDPTPDPAPTPDTTSSPASTPSPHATSSLRCATALTPIHAKPLQPVNSGGSGNSKAPGNSKGSG